MGIHGNATCVMNYDGATGYLVGEPEKGLAAMFIMMNAARLGVGIQGLAQGEVAYQNAVTYANERRQGRALTGAKDEDAKADPIIVHPDVRRMLMDARAFTEGARALTLWAALQIDLAHNAQTEEEREEADEIVGLLTPVIKGYFHRQGLRDCRRGAAGLWRPWLCARMGHGAVCPRCSHRADLRGHQRHPGDGPRRPQARAEGRQGADGSSRRW